MGSNHVQERWDIKLNAVSRIQSVKKNLGGTGVASANRNKAEDNEEDEEMAMLESIIFACFICKEASSSHDVATTSASSVPSRGTREIRHTRRVERAPTESSILRQD